jgi:two-component system clock-associated histidine kinase SasA
MEAISSTSAQAEVVLQLLLFIDQRPSSKDKVRQIRNYLDSIDSKYPVELDIVDVGEQPYLAEHFKLVATPALIKLSPTPQQILAGSNIPDQIEQWWSRWTKALDENKANQRKQEEANATLGTVAQSAEIIELSDQIFQLKREREELQAQLQFKDRIIAMLAHDLRNPLTAASLAIETLEMGYDPDQGWNERFTPKLITQLLKHARTQTHSIDRMITDILQAARGACADIHIQPAELNLRELFLSVITDLATKCEAKQQQLETDIPEDLPRVHADSERMRQVITNLIDNAIKYTPECGKIHVSALHRTTQKVQVIIGDTGPGIPEENQERIFEDSFRLERDESKDGYGIGLSLCQRIVRAHYGQIWVDSVPGHGSCFHFTLPVYR